MAMFDAAGARKVVFQLHLWVALILCLALVPLGLTGSALMMPDTLNRLTNPVPQVAAGASQATMAPSAYLDAARAAMPKNVKITGVKMPTAPGVPVAVNGTTGAPGPGGGRTAWLDPSTAHVLKVGPSTAPLFAFSHDFHGAFMVNGVGRQAVGWAGVAMTFLSLTGIWLWWPRGAFLKGFIWRRTPDTMNNLHHLAGFWISIPLAVISLTGVFISFPSLTNAVFGAAPTPPGAGRPAEGPGGAGRVSGPPRQTPDQAVALAQAANPGAQFASLTFPGVGGRGPAAGPRNAWRIEVSDQGKTSAVMVDDATGAVSAVAPQGPRGGGQTGPRAMIRPLHEGLVGGPIWKVLVFIAGVLPLLLAVTGVYLWGRNELRKAAAR